MVALQIAVMTIKNLYSQSLVLNETEIMALHEYFENFYFNCPLRL